MRIELLVLILTILFSCDFTPPLNKKIIEAQSLIRDNNYKEAVQKYKVILKQNPPNEIKVKILYQIGDLYSIYLTEIESSLTYYREVFRLSEDKGWKLKSLERLADLNFTHIKKYKDAINYYKTLLRETTAKNKIDFFEYRIAQSYYKSSDFHLAIIKFKEIQNNESHVFYTRSIYYIGMINFYLENWEKAIHFLDKYVGREKNRDDSVQAKFILANALESRENLVAAYEIYSSILGEYPNTKVVKAKLKSIYKRRVSRKRN